MACTACGEDGHYAKTCGIDPDGWSTVTLKLPSRMIADVDALAIQLYEGERVSRAAACRRLILDGLAYRDVIQGR